MAGTGIWEAYGCHLWNQCAAANASKFSFASCRSSRSPLPAFIFLGSPCTGNFHRWMNGKKMTSTGRKQQKVTKIGKNVAESSKKVTKIGKNVAKVGPAFFSFTSNSFSYIGLVRFSSRGHGSVACLNSLTGNVFTCIV